jgi:flagellar motor switch protein FliN/FliY
MSREQTARSGDANPAEGSFALGESGSESDNRSEERGVMISSEANRFSKSDFSKLKSLFDVPLKVSVLIGQTKMLTSEILALQSGTVVELDKLAGEAMEICINDKLVALGEVVVVNEKYGVRLTDVISGFQSAPSNDK